MANSNTAGCHSERLIDEIETTSDRLTGRAGLVLFSRYLRGIGIFPHLNRLFGSLRRSRKGLPVVEIFYQLLCFFLDGTSRHLTYFDALKEDPGYAGAIETAPESMLSRSPRGRGWTSLSAESRQEDTRVPVGSEFR